MKRGEKEGEKKRKKGGRKTEMKVEERKRRLNCHERKGPRGKKN